MRNRTRPRTRLGSRSVVAASLLGSLTLALALAACGSGDDPNAQVASLAGTETTGGDGTAATDTTTPTSVDPEDAMLAFAKCMREHGVDMPDPQVSGDGRGSVVQIGSAGAPQDKATLDAAQQACQHFMDAAVQDQAKQLDPEEEAKRQQEALDFSKCMRDHGIDFPDPVFGDNGTVSISLGEPGQGGIDPQSPEFQQAQDECGRNGGFIGAKGAPGGDGGSTGKVVTQSGSATGSGT
jgi:hypothetical protein